MAKRGIMGSSNKMVKDFVVSWENAIFANKYY